MNRGAHGRARSGGGHRGEHGREPPSLHDRRASGCRRTIAVLSGGQARAEAGYKRRRWTWVEWWRRRLDAWTRPLPAKRGARRPFMARPTSQPSYPHLEYSEPTGTSDQMLATSRSSVPFFSHGAASACAAAHEQKYVVTPLHVPARWADGGACHPAPARSVQVRPGARAPPARRVPDQGQRRLPSAVENRLDTTAFT